MLFFMGNSTHEEPLSQTLHTNIKQFKIAATFLSSYNAIFNVTNNIKKPFFISLQEGADYNVITLTRGVYEIENLNAEIN